MLNKLPLKQNNTPKINLPLRTNLNQVLNTISTVPTETKTEPAEECVVINPQIPSEYLNDIYHSLLEEEKLIKVTNYIEFQTDINEKMRGILIDWLIEVHNKFGLKEETIFLTVYLLDQYLNKEFTPRSRLQLLGVAALMIACKQEEILVPCISDLVFVTDNAYTKTEVLEMEKLILKTLDFNIVSPSSLRFFEIISYSFKFSEQMISFGKYILVLMNLNYKMSKYIPSVRACTTAYVVMKYYKYTNYAELYERWNTNSDNTVLKECARETCHMMDNLGKIYSKGVNKMFASDKYYGVSNLKLS
jgi:cyclin B